MMGLEMPVEKKEKSEVYNYMKNPNIMNPWVIVRWAFVTVIFAGTVMVAMDQVKDARTECEGLKKKLANAHDILILYQKRIERLEKYEEESIQRSRNFIKAVKVDLDNASKYIAKTEELKLRLAAINAEDKSNDVDVLAEQMIRRLDLQKELMDHVTSAPKSIAQKLE